MAKSKSSSRKRRPRAVSLPDRLFDIARKNPDGFTVKVVDGKIQPFEFSKPERYIVSTTNNITKTEIRKSFKGFREGLVGGWYDSKSGKYYIDKNLAVASESTAFALGRKYRQKAIFDYKTKKVVDVPHEMRLAKRKRKKRYKKKRTIRIQRYDKRVQRYRVAFDPYERGYFYDSQKKIWIHAKRFTYYSSRGFYRINAVDPDHFFSTQLLFKKMFTGQWYPLAYFDQILNRILRPSLSNRTKWQNCYRFYGYEYKRGYLFYRNGKLRLVILEEHAREKT